ncbi:MAG TPA: hypothetical protein PKA82_01885 [Pyrinomonadaceae bacterium]|mgnify:CR=1 FL=1|nr:hypothetical protein [Pyrinomonadaceae bacterium]
MAISRLEARTIKDALVPILMSDKSLTVHAIGIGNLTDGDTEDPSVEIYVEDLEQLGSEKELLDRIPSEYHDKPLVFIVSPRAHASAGTTAVFDPHAPFQTLVPGISIGNASLKKEYGTLGYFCKKLNKKGSTLPGTRVLSNAHVLADLYLADPMQSPHVHQPAFPHNGSLPVAVLEEFIKIDFSDPPAKPNLVDAAIAILEGRRRNLPIPKLGKVGSSIKHPNIKVNWKCAKFGAKTSLRFGSIRAIHATTSIYYDAVDDDAIFEEQLIIQGKSGSTFSEKGDSGSLVVKGNPTKIDSKLEALGLLFAETYEFQEKRPRKLTKYKAFRVVTVDSFTVANPISAVATALNIELEV